MSTLSTGSCDLLAPGVFGASLGTRTAVEAGCRNLAGLNGAAPRLPATDAEWVNHDIDLCSRFISTCAKHIDGYPAGNIDNVSEASWRAPNAP